MNDTVRIAVIALVVMVLARKVQPMLPPSVGGLLA